MEEAEEVVEDVGVAVEGVAEDVEDIRTREIISTTGLVVTSASQTLCETNLLE